MLDTGNALPKNLRFVLDSFNLLNPEHIDAIIQAALKSGCGMIVIDTLNRATPGTDENSSKDMGHIIEAASKIQTATGGLVLLVTHSGKDTKKGIRGHSSLIAALDTSIEVERKGDARVLVLDKVKEGEDGITRDFQLKVVTIGHEPDGNKITSCVVEPVARQDKEKALSASLKYTLDSLLKTCEAEGSVSAHLEAWRTVFYAGHAGDTIEAKRKAFERSRKELVSKGIITVLDDFYTSGHTGHTGHVPDKSDMSWQDFNPDDTDTPLKGCPVCPDVPDDPEVSA